MNASHVQIRSRSYQIGKSRGLRSRPSIFQINLAFVPRVLHGITRLIVGGKFTQSVSSNKRTALLYLITGADACSSDQTVHALHMSGHTGIGFKRGMANIAVQVLDRKSVV